LPNVLLVEDDPLVALLVREELEASGYEVTHADNAPEALAAIAEPRSFEALVTDIDLGGPTDGFSVAHCARSAQPGIPVVFISGAAGVRFRAEAVQPSCFLAKPFLMSQLTEALQEATG
jgi:two-component system, OmpR family, response regulator